MRWPDPLPLARRLVYLPWAQIPAGRAVELPGRGRTWVTDVPGPTPDAPVVVLLHALACTGVMTWFATLAPLSRRFRVITFDQRWHGRGIVDGEFSLYDCADDVAALLDVLDVDQALVAGYSMGSLVAQRVWRQHPDRTAGLVLCATTDRFRPLPHERAFFGALEATMMVTRGLSHSRTVRAASAAAARLLPPEDMHAWLLGEFARTSPWAVGQALAGLSRHHSEPWLPRIDVPTAVVVPRHDHLIPPQRQVAVARAIPGATLHEIDAGHVACVLETEHFVPAFLEAVTTVHARRRDFPRRVRARA